ncbi:MAG: LacI family DNA-binding transcriptional regulator [Actinomycetales bacterium]
MRRQRLAPAPPSAVTIHDIAREAGVSTATVSRALRNLPSVATETRERIRLIAERHDYVISPTASRLASGKAGSIGVVTPFIARWYFATLLSGVEQVLRDSEHDLVLVRAAEPTTPGEREQAHRHARETVRRLRGRVDALLVFSLSVDDPHVAALTALERPVTLVGRSAAAGDWSSVGIDDRLGAAKATQHLLNLGHRRIGLIGGRGPSSHFAVERDRHAGFAETMAAAGLSPEPALVTQGDFTAAGGEQAMSDLLALPQPPTAVFAMSDEMAYGALRSLRRHGLTPGRDVSVVGFDDQDMSDLLELTTVAQPVAQLGILAARTLLAQLGGRPAERAQTLATRLVVRQSTGPTPQPRAGVARHDTRPGGRDTTATDTKT